MLVSTIPYCYSQKKGTQYLQSQTNSEGRRGPLILLLQVPRSVHTVRLIPPRHSLQKQVPLALSHISEQTNQHPQFGSLEDWPILLANYHLHPPPPRVYRRNIGSHTHAHPPLPSLPLLLCCSISRYSTISIYYGRSTLPHSPHAAHPRCQHQRQSSERQHRTEHLSCDFYPVPRLSCPVPPTPALVWRCASPGQVAHVSYRPILLSRLLSQPPQYRQSTLRVRLPGHRTHSPRHQSLRNILQQLRLLESHPRAGPN